MITCGNQTLRAAVLTSRVIRFIFENMPASSARKRKRDEPKKVVPNHEEGPRYWLMKSEPESRMENGVDAKFGIEDLRKEPNETACWDGVRNYQARNLMRDEMKMGDVAFFYHSNCKIPGIAGITEIVREGYEDDTQFLKTSNHYDPKATKSEPRWFMVDVKFIRYTKRFISLKELKKIHLDHKGNGGPLKALSLFTQSRLSVQPIRKEEYEYIITMEEKDEL